MSKTIGDNLPFWHFEDDLMIFSDGSLGAGFKLEGIDISCADDQKINRFSKNIENLINSSPEGMRLQVFYKLNANASNIIKKHQDISKDSSPLYQEIAKERINFLKDNNKQEMYFLPEIYFFIRNTPIVFKKQGLFEKDHRYAPIAKDVFDSSKERFARTIKQVESSFNQTYLGATRIIQDEWFELLYQYYNFKRSKEVATPILRSNGSIFHPTLIEQLLLTDLNIQRNALKIGNQYFRLLTLKTLPEGATYASIVDQFLKLPFHFWISQNISIHEQKKEIDKLQVQRRLAHSFASGSKNVSDLESENKFHHIEELLRELLEGSEKLVSSDFNVIVWGDDINELEEKSYEILKAFKSLNQAEGLIETYPLLEAFTKATPGCCEGFRHKNMKSSNVSHLMPLFSYWRGNKTPVCLLPNRDYGLVGLNPFADELPNWNGLVFGGSGSGKSFTLCQLMLQFYGQSPKPKIIWIDNGASSKPLVEILEGSFLDLTLDSKICLNPFDLEQGNNKPDPSKIKLILGVLETILKDEEKQFLPKKDKASLEEAIFEVYKTTKGIPTLSDLKKLLSAHKDERMREYAQILYSWTGNTAYGKLLDGQTTISLDKDLVTIEIKGLDSYPDLQNVLLLLFTDFIKREASKDLSTPYLLIIDEAWKLFETPSGMAFALEAYRTFRKYNAGIYLISQNYKDFLSKQEIKNAVFPNTTHLFILRQGKIDWEDFGKTLDFNPSEIEIVKSLTISKGYFSEIFYQQNENKTVLRLIPDPLSYWICTTDGKDRSKINKVRCENPEYSKLEVLKIIIKSS